MAVAGAVGGDMNRDVADVLSKKGRSFLCSLLFTEVFEIICNKSILVTKGCFLLKAQYQLIGKSPEEEGSEGQGLNLLV